MTATTGHLPAGESPSCTDPKCSAPRWGDSQWCRAHLYWTRQGRCALCDEFHSFTQCPYLPSQGAAEAVVRERLATVLRAVDREANCYDIIYCADSTIVDQDAHRGIVLEEVADRMGLQRFALD